VEPGAAPEGNKSRTKIGIAVTLMEYELCTVMKGKKCKDMPTYSLIWASIFTFRTRASSKNS
jgi:hypothetical protein